MLDQITPLILTRNEEPNIARTLGQLTWAKDIVIVDSISDDATVEIAQRFPHVRLFQRPIDTLAGQTNYGLAETGITASWVLLMDADYFVTEEFIRELAALKPGDDVAAFEGGFIYAVFGKRLRASLYPPRPVLLRRGRCSCYQDGHAHRIKADGGIGALRERIIHDDRKRLSSFLLRQQKYMEQEADKLLHADRKTLRPIDRLRLLRILAPFAAFAHALVAKRCLLDGWPGIYYAFERLIAEAILSMTLVARDFTTSFGSSDRPSPADPSSS